VSNTTVKFERDMVLFKLSLVIIQTYVKNIAFEKSKDVGSIIIRRTRGIGSIELNATGYMKYG
jgi:hypothetical protein